MNPVNSIGPLLEVLRKRTEDIAPTKSFKSKATRGTAQPNLESIRQQIIDALDEIPAHETGGQQKAVRVFVEKILLWRFGRELLADPAFNRIVDELSIEMSEDSVISELMTIFRSVGG